MKRLLLFCAFLLFFTLYQPVLGQDCAAAPVPQLAVGLDGVVRFTDGQPLNLRDMASLAGQVVERIPEGEHFTVLAGPQCADGIYWWQISVANTGTIGWIAEGVDDVYFVELANSSRSVNLPAEFLLVVQLDNGSLVLLDTDLKVLDEFPSSGGELVTLSNHYAYVYAPQVLPDSVLVIDAHGQHETFDFPQMEGVLVNFAVAPDDSAIAWLYDQTVTQPTFDCDAESDCSRIYSLVVTDSAGQNMREIWHSEIGYPFPLVDLGGWVNGHVMLRYIPWGVAGAFFEIYGGRPTFIEPQTKDIIPWDVEESYLSYFTYVSADGAFFVHPSSSEWDLAVRDFGGNMVYLDEYNDDTLTGNIRISPDSRYVMYEELRFDSGMIVSNQIKLLDLTSTDVRPIFTLEGEAIAAFMTWLTPSIVTFSNGLVTYVMDISSGMSAPLILGDGHTITMVYGLIQP